MNQMDSASRTKRKRRAAPLDDRGAMRVTTKTLQPLVEPEEKSTGGLANMTGSGTPEAGGKLYPAQGSGFKGLLDDEKARQPPGTPTHTNKAKRKATVNHDSIAKLVDVNAYDASVQSNAALRDDFNVVMSWHGEWKKRPSGYKFGRRKLGFIMGKILAEAAARGPGVMRFDTGKMGPEQRAFFTEVAGRVGLPQKMMKGSSMDDIDLVNLDVSKFKLDKLYMLHNLSHLMHAEEWRKGDREDCAQLVGLHALIVSELEARGSEHPLPPRDELDRTSRDFEVVNLNKFLEDSNPGGFANVDKSEALTVLKDAAQELWNVCKGCACKTVDGVKQCKGGRDQRADGYAPPGAAFKGVDGFPSRDSEPELAVIDEEVEGRKKFVGADTRTPIDREPPVPDPGTKPRHPPERPAGGATVPQRATT